MDGKELKGRKIRVDFDVVQKPKEGYKTNTSKEGNKFYNKSTLKDINVKRQRKVKDKQKASMGKVNLSI